ncbi:hypothetical protein HGRIS_013769 [Hohenbuehelia grisea]|uniref:Methyltransferase domain-containing protein n=1 Tax=Hohenbuehelia grisea TaxID=104357 RepID=A0ABR3IWT7_9AGAR
MAQNTQQDSIGAGAHDKVVAANEAHFDNVSAKVNSIPLAQQLGRFNAGLLRSIYPFDPAKTEVMDFACGTGLIAQHLSEHCKSILGVDISQGMVDEFNRLAESLKIPRDKMSAIRTTLTGAEGELEGRKFDVIACVMAYHHFPSLSDTTRVLVHFLKPGGTLLVIDGHDSPNNDYPLWVSYWTGQAGATGGHSHEHHHEDTTKAPSKTMPENFDSIIPHKVAMSEEGMRPVFEGEGLEAFELRVSPRDECPGQAIEIFVAKGTKPITA